MSQDPAASYGLTRNNFTAGGGDNFGILTQGTDRVVGLADPAALIDPVVRKPWSVPYYDFLVEKMNEI